MAKTIHVIPYPGGWAVRREGGKEGEVFTTQKDAIARARTISKEISPSQVVVYTRGGRIASVEVRGFPKIQKSPLKSSIGTRNIEKAISEIVRSRLVPATGS